MDKNTLIQYGWIVIVAILALALIVGAAPIANNLMQMAEDEIKSDTITYTISLEPNGGTLTQKHILVIPQKAYGFLPTPKNEGKIFVGWFTAADGGTKVSSQTIFKGTGDSTLYAHWK